MFTHLKHMDLSKLYHVGFLDQNNLSSRPVVSFSLEGNGLSVSLHPQAWTQIAQLGGSNLYVLQKDNPKFFMAYEDETDKAVSWAIENDYIIPAKKKRGYFGDEYGNEFFTEIEFSDDEEEYEEIKIVDDYAFSQKGKAYWSQYFSSEISHFHAKSFAIIFYAESHGFDGVWWNEELDPGNYSAPRGVIFQEKLVEWSITETDQYPDED